MTLKLKGLFRHPLSEDPKEFNDLAAQKAYQPVLEDLKSRLLSHWDGVDLERKVRRSQKERLLIEAATGGEWRRF